ncbi:MAG: IS66 family transposase [Planctomycetota bacterium]|nr:IS66 family transposase [Planctomycetota bacterium]
MRKVVREGVDLDAFRSEAVALMAEGKNDDVIALASGKIGQLNWALTQLNLTVRQLMKKHLGRTTEKLDPAQLSLLLQGQQPAPDLEALLQDDEVAEELKRRQEEDKKTKKKRKPGPKPLPPHLERRRVVLEVPPEDCVCPECSALKFKCGEEVSEVLDMEPAIFFVWQYVRPKMACSKCQAHVSIAPPADKVIDGGRPGPALLAHAIVGKYQDHNPLHRLHRIYLRYGVDVAVSTLCDWMRAGHEMLQPLVAAIVRMALAAFVLQVDDTGIKVRDPAAPGGIRRGHLWGHVGDGKWACFYYTADWKGEHPQAFLRDRVGYTQADAYKGYDALFASPNAKQIEVGCNAHARRYWTELLDSGDSRAATPLKLYQKLYQVERLAKVRNLEPDGRHELRQMHSRPLMNGLFAWIVERHGAEPPKSLFAKASGYAIRQQAALQRFLEHGAIPIDNTGVERALRPICSGRRNYLFCGSDEGAKRAATMYTILGTCALNGVEPSAYLTDVLQKLAGGWLNSRLDELLPPNWIEAHPQHRTGVPAPASNAI